MFYGQQSSLLNQNAGRFIWNIWKMLLNVLLVITKGNKKLVVPTASEAAALFPTSNEPHCCHLRDDTISMVTSTYPTDLLSYLP